MAIVSLIELLDFCGIGKEYFIITAANDVLKLKYNTGVVTDIDIADGTYEGESLAVQLQSKINTAFPTASATVSYSTTTKKFTIAVISPNTIAYTHLGSDAGFTLGFDKDHAAAISIISDLAAGDPSAILESIRDGVENWVENYCHRIFEETEHTEYHDGHGGGYLDLRYYPIIDPIESVTENDNELDPDDYEVYTNEGMLYKESRWGKGHRNILVVYTAGYVADDMPKDLKLAIKIICKNIHQKRKEEIFGVRQYSVGDVNVACEDGDIPKEAKAILEKYRKVFIV